MGHYNLSLRIHLGLGLHYLSIGLTALGIILFLFTSSRTNSHSDASSPLESRGPITLYSTLVQSSEEYLYAYLEDTLTLNVYRPDGTFLHSYMMPNENCGTSSLHSYMGDVYISVYRNSGIHRYGPTGDYLGSFEDDILYTANGKYRGRFEIPPHYEVIGFTDEFLYLFVRETGAFYCTSKNGEIEPFESETISLSDGDYYVKWSTLYDPDGTKLDQSPIFSIFYTHAFTALSLTVIGSILDHISKIIMRTNKH